MRLLILTAAFITSVVVHAQILVLPPYVLLKDSVKQTKWKLCEGKNTMFRLKQSPEYYRGKVKIIQGDSIFIKKQGWFRVADMDYITFKPKSKLRQYVRLTYYSLFIAGSFYAFSIASDYPQESGIPFFFPFIYGFIILPPAIMIGETGGLVIQLFSPWREFYTADCWQMSVVE